MIFDAILMSLGEITTMLSPNRDLAVILEMKSKDALFTNQGYRVLFSGTIDYVVIQYEKDEDDDNHGNLLHCRFPHGSAHFF